MPAKKLTVNDPHRLSPCAKAFVRLTNIARIASRNTVVRRIGFSFESGPKRLLVGYVIQLAIMTGPQYRDDGVPRCSGSALGSHGPVDRWGLADVPCWDLDRKTSSAG